MNDFKIAFRQLTKHPGFTAIAVRTLTNDEFQMTNQIRNPNDEGRTCGRTGIGSTFGLCHAFDIRHSDFVIVQSLLTSAPTSL